MSANHSLFFLCPLLPKFRMPTARSPVSSSRLLPFTSATLFLTSQIHHSLLPVHLLCISHMVSAQVCFLPTLGLSILGYQGVGKLGSVDRLTVNKVPTGTHPHPFIYVSSTIHTTVQYTVLGRVDSYNKECMI